MKELEKSKKDYSLDIKNLNITGTNSNEKEGDEIVIDFSDDIFEDVDILIYE